MDQETGEKWLDTETGEMLPLQVLNSRPTYENQITTTPNNPTTTNTNNTVDNDQQQLSFERKKTFKIPQSKVAPKKYKTKLTRMNTATNDISPIILFLLPTLLVYPAITIIPVVLELMIHLWAHRKNKTLKDPNFYYRSPLHVYVSGFCAKCCEENCMTRIGKMQDKRTMKYDSLRHLVS